MEIGSEFWLEKIPQTSSVKTLNFLQKFNETMLTSSGRGAITLLLQQIQPVQKSVLLPAYICESVILPFLEQEYDCKYYEVDENLVPNIESINSHENIGVFFHMGYYGFSTNSNLENVLESFRETSTIIVEDITHTLFSSYERSKFNNYYVGSIRKWVGIPSGGFLASNAGIEKKSLDEDTIFSNKRFEALINKGKYMSKNEPEIKELSLSQFSEAEGYLNLDSSPYRMDKLSVEILNTLNEEELIRKRKDNYMILSNGIKNINYLQPLFETIDEKCCPMFFPILLKENRSSIRSKLAEQDIYCPIHWPLPPQIDINVLGNTVSIYNNVLSIPCDQRYEIKDMNRIIAVLKSIK